MEIFMETSFSASVSGMQTYMTRHDVTAHNVANVNTPGFEAQNANQAEQAPAGVTITSITRTPNPSATDSNTDLAKEAGEQIVNKHAVAANAKVMKVQDRMLGDLLDMVG
jgi:flagellar hook protein FlgE